jgi:hypothetical protein
VGGLEDMASYYRIIIVAVAILLCLAVVLDFHWWIEFGETDIMLVAGMNGEMTYLRYDYHTGVAIGFTTEE